MIRPKTRWLVVLLTLLVMASFALPAQAVDLTSFQDIRGFWAEEAIIEAQAIGITNGVSATRYGKTESLTRRQALTMLIRAMGLSDEAQRLDTSNIQFPPDVKGWGQAEIALAQQKQLFSGQISQIKFNDPASRLEVACWVAKALELPLDDTPLVYTDTAGIPDAYKKMVAAVHREGIMTGQTPTTFGPQVAVTRSHMATLLSRALDQGLIDPYPGRFVIGRLDAVDWTGNKLTLSTSSGSATYPLQTGYVVYRGGKKSVLSSMVKNDPVKVVLDEDHKVIFVALCPADLLSARSQQYTGKIMAITSSDQLFLQTDGGTVLTLNLSPSVSVTRSGATVWLSDVDPGTRATVKVLSGRVTAITLEGTASGADVEGRVVEVYPSSDAILMKIGTKEIFYSLTSGCDVYFGSRSGDFEDIEEDDEAALFLNSSGLVTKIVLDAESDEVEGTITSYRTGSSPRIGIEMDDDEETYYLDDDVTVERDGDELDIEDILIGAEVRLELDDEVVTLVEILDDEDITVEGEIVSIGSARLTIEQDSGLTFRFYFRDGADLYDEDEDEIDISDLEEEWTVSLDLRDGEIRRLDVLDS